ncbi:MAG: Rpn family recombination-promoting nuclease/putative transposase [Eubacteriaceae bacterium]
MERLNPLNDFIFKKLMGEEESKENLIAFINSVLDPEDQVDDIEIINNKELTKEMISDKTGRLDVRAKTIDGCEINIEVQLSNQRNMEKRTMFYWGKLFLEGIKQGEEYIQLSKVITINILDFDYLDIERFHTKYHLWEDEEEDYMLTDLIEIHFIEMPKFRQLKRKDIENNSLHRWLKFFDRRISEEEIKELIEMDTAIKRAEAKLKHLGSDPETLSLYRAREDSLHERANMISSAKEEGVKEGVKEGKVLTAKAALIKGLSSDVIADITGLSIEEIQKIKKEIIH